MKAQYTTQTPDFSNRLTPVLIAAVFTLPLMIWGDRWPWLVAIPVAIMVALTIRSEWNRSQWRAHQQLWTEVTFLPEITIQREIIWTPSDEHWVAVEIEDIPGNTPKVEDYIKPVRTVHEQFAVAA